MTAARADFENSLRQLFARHQGGDLLGARQGYLEWLPQYPEEHDLLFLLGMAECQLGNPEQGAEFLGRAIQVMPHDADARFNRAVAFENLQRYAEAIAEYDQVINLRPTYSEAFYNRGNILNILGRPQEAVRSFEQAINLKPNYPEAYNNRGNSLRAIGQLEEAVKSYDQAITLNANYADAFNNRGTILRDVGRAEDALANFNHAISLKPNFPDLYFNKAIALQDLRRFDEALQSYAQVLQLQPTHPEVHNNCGAIYREMGQLTKALEAFDDGLRLNPKSTSLLNNRAVTLQQLGRYPESLESYDQAITLNPDYAQAHWNKGYLKLLLGDFIEGHKLLEWRLQVPQYARQLPQFIEPRWDGKQSLKDKTILIYPEFDLSDLLQYCRLIPLVESIGAKVIFEVPTQAFALLKTLQANIEVIEKGSTLPKFDFHLPLLSLPALLKLEQDSVPSKVPYLFPSDAQLQDAPKKRGRKPAAKKKKEIGICWSNLGITPASKGTSIPLEQLEELLLLPHNFHSLQRSYQEIDRIVMEAYPKLVNHEEEWSSLLEQAQFIEKLDLVIAVNGPTAHLAAALGKEVWILVEEGADYRWGLESEGSVWYPTATLFRKSASKPDWSAVANKVLAKLES